MTDARIASGRRAEAFAASELMRNRLRVIERNVRVRYTELGIAGEIDIVAIDGTTLVFVEVKATRAGGRAGPERPALAVTPSKARRLRRLARARLSSPPPLPRFDAIRFDVVGVTLDAGGQPIGREWIRNAF
ncbi:MAG: YraN family protein [Solirubrobacterales bacterium]